MTYTPPSAKSFGDVLTSGIVSVAAGAYLDFYCANGKKAIVMGVTDAPTNSNFVVRIYRVSDGTRSQGYMGEGNGQDIIVAINDQYGVSLKNGSSSAWTECIMALEVL